MCMQNERTIGKLLEGDKKIYVYLRNHEVFKQFILEARKEGFLFSDGTKPRSKKYCDIMAVNDDFAICYVGYVGRRNFYDAKCTTRRIDYQKYITLWDDYSYKKNK